jgi:hypothetical protein
MVSRTKEYAALMGRQVGIVIKDFGAGTGLSDADREYAESIAGADIENPMQTLRNLMRINEAMIRRKIAVHNERADKLLSKPGAKDKIHYPVKIENMPAPNEYYSDVAYRANVLPQSAKDYGVTAKQWRVMPPKDRQKFIPTLK